MFYHRMKVLRTPCNVSSGLWIILLEAGLALALLLALVWWTLPKRPKSGEQASRSGGDPPRTP
ncbi:MAG TPA: hypothetical protein VFI80_11735 [Burkholderiales bacterium]|nr:hypothetical protein [Burkholderiales bacterium]